MNAIVLYVLMTLNVYTQAQSDEFQVLSKQKIQLKGLRVEASSI